MPLQFDPTASFDENLARFRTETETLDLECARILFDNLDKLMRGGGDNRQAIQEFNTAVLAALVALP
jgi:hypothetical protein